MFKIHNKYKQLTIILLGALFANLSIIANADTLKRKVIAAGGGNMVAGDYKLAYTIGQPIISTTINTPLISGFWKNSTNKVVMLGVEADSITASACQNFDITIQVQAPDTQAVDSASAYLNFDPSVLKVVKVKPATALDLNLDNQFNNAAGHIDFSAATMSFVPPKGTFDLMTITFKAKKQTNQTGLIFNSTGTRTTDVLLGVNSIFSGAEPVIFPVENLGTLAGKVSLKNHPLRVHVSPPTPEAFYQVTTNNRGKFILPDNFSAGTYDVYVAASNTLQIKKTTTVAACNTKTLFFGTLKAGDVIGVGPTPPDNIVSLVDFGAFRTYFWNQPIPILDYNLDGVVDAADSDADFLEALFDLNDNGSVGADDVKPIQDNFNQFGDDKVGGPYPRKSQRDSKPITPLSYFEATVFIEVAQPVDAVSAHLIFDANALQVNQITPSDRFDTLLQNQFDNNTGNIYFAAGQLAKETPSGTIELMTIQFAVLQEGGEKTLTVVNTESISGVQTIPTPEVAEKIVLKEVEVVQEAPVPCQLYAVHDKGLNNSQFFTVDNLEVKALGTIHPGYDIEALDAHPDTDRLYAGAGDDTDYPGYLYTVSPQGVLTEIGDTGFDEIEALTFHPNGQLWGWAKGEGLITITLLPNNEIDAQLVFPSEAPIEALTWNNDGTLLYAAENSNLWKSDGQTIEKACNLLGHIEALEMLPDNLLLVGVHGKKNILEFKMIDLVTCDLVQGVSIPTNYNDVEGIAWPEKACGEM